MAGDGLSRGLSDMWRSVVLLLPSAVAFLVILIAGWLLARLARAITARTLRRIGFDRAVQRGPAGRLARPGVPGATDVCARLAYLVVLLFTLQLAFGVWPPNPAGDLLNALIAWLPRVFVAIVVVVAAAALAGAAHDLILAVLGALGYARVLARAAATVIVTLGVIAGLDQAGIATSVTRPLLVAVLATVAGVIIVGVGGGLIRPMQHRWEGWLDRAAAESAVMREQARAYTEERARRSDPAPEVTQAGESPATPSADPPAAPDLPAASGPAPQAAPGSPVAASPFGGSGRDGGDAPAAVVADPGAGSNARREEHRDSAAGPGAGSNPRAEEHRDSAAAEPSVPEDWEARWAEEERRARELDGDRTQVINPPAGGTAGGATGDGPAGGAATTVTRPGTVVFKPGVRPPSAVPPDDEPTAVTGEERTVFLHDEEPTTFIRDDEPTTIITGWAENHGAGQDTTAILADGERADGERAGGERAGGDRAVGAPADAATVGGTTDSGTTDDGEKTVERPRRPE
ncbi:mechanosensitive ion channel family protein [Actinoplanes sp. G11-F43]|uniref:mechanosensitive ion channel family protein n=1 Tax=Actinoplanes sp. G11-F43 TaxID=3424130 RepID=UPI003D33B583